MNEQDPVERHEDEWLNRLADEAESEGTDGSISLTEMAALLRLRVGQDTHRQLMQQPRVHERRLGGGQ